MLVENASTAETEKQQVAGDLFELIARVEEEETGVFDASLNRATAKALVDAGYSLKPETEVKTRVNDLFSIIIDVEHERNGIFRASLARQTARALVEAGCSL